MQVKKQKINMFLNENRKQAESCCRRDVSWQTVPKATVGDRKGTVTDSNFHWKAGSGFPIRVNWTICDRCYD